MRRLPAPRLSLIPSRANFFRAAPRRSENLKIRGYPATSQNGETTYSSEGGIEQQQQRNQLPTAVEDASTIKSSSFEKKKTERIVLTFLETGLYLASWHEQLQKKV